MKLEINIAESIYEDILNYRDTQYMYHVERAIRKGKIIEKPRVNNRRVKECRCWSPYPNEAYKKANGDWKCMHYKCVKQRVRNYRKTVCELVENEDDNKKV